MSFVSEIVSPLIQKYNRWLDGPYIAEQLQYKGGEGVGGDYVNKINRANRRSVQQRYDDTLQTVKNPTYSAFLEDNLFRFLLNPFDRLIAAYQAYPVLKARFHKPGSFSHTFTQIMNQGVIFGAYKGAILGFAQLSLVLYPAVIAANHSASQNKFLTFLGTYTALDTILYPLDTLKSILYADTLGKYSFKTVFNATTFGELYRGIFLKLIYNVPVLSGIYCTTQTGLQVQAALSWLAAAVLYPLNTFKIRQQVNTSGLSTVNAQTGNITHGAYRGVLPYLLLNFLIGYTLRPLFSKQKLSQIQGQVKHQISHRGFDL